MKFLSRIKSICTAFLLQIFIASVAHASDEVEMADRMRANGKIYVVVSVIAIVFTGITLYLVMLDRKLGKLEKAIKEKNN